MFDIKCTEYIQFWHRTDMYYTTALIGSGDSWDLYMRRPAYVSTQLQYGVDKEMVWDLIATDCTWDVIPTSVSDFQSSSSSFPCDVVLP